eukprot:CAMPEP_0177417692 /NCGR_PEP_ID=MMETSP0368-20130122/68796_1 /TAXON_ID=447022 ORGANISM="Scrippsiella hangoei-like, Strain SHHI-4" /NCGR_SAMPLE_ID=MMETSP0368 /ASSEMBLY_ACC=CAM_ASM_000363 /LENGTH=46 /DNA_ID= /DNA_START= /DNA_END= /DNA_ORIENTATION=
MASGQAATLENARQRYALGASAFKGTGGDGAPLQTWADQRVRNINP